MKGNVINVFSNKDVIQSLKDAKICLKRKRIYGIIVIIALHGVINVINFIVFRMTMVRLDQMIAITIRATGISNVAGTPTLMMIV